jgi:SAM-dependent methyltransferase
MTARRSAATAPLFERLADRYDAWYDGPAGSVLFPMEVACLAPLLDGLPKPWLEVGTGSGRFAHTLEVGYGVDPARAPLRLAAGRGIRVVQAVGERLPFRDASFGAVLAVVTLCFADDVDALLAEARRVLKEDGGVVLGDVFADSPWGGHYRTLGAKGHPFYAFAHFLTRGQTMAALRRAGLRLARARSTLCQPPTETPASEPPIDGETQNAGFVGWLAVPS